MALYWLIFHLLSANLHPPALPVPTNRKEVGSMRSSWRGLASIVVDSTAQASSPGLKELRGRGVGFGVRASHDGRHLP